MRKVFRIHLGVLNIVKLATTITKGSDFCIHSEFMAFSRMKTNE